MQCLGDGDCTEGDATKCDLATNTCVECTSTDLTNCETRETCVDRVCECPLSCAIGDGVNSYECGTITTCGSNTEKCGENYNCAELLGIETHTGCTNNFWDTSSTECLAKERNGGNMRNCQKMIPTCGLNGCLDNENWANINTGLFCDSTDVCQNDVFYTGKVCTSGACSLGTGAPCADATCFDIGDGTYSQTTDSICVDVSGGNDYCSNQITTPCNTGYACNDAGTACATSCATDEDCVTGYGCVDGECGLCDISVAGWSVSTAREGDEVSLVVEGNKFCDGVEVEFFYLMEQDALLNPDDSVNTMPANAVFSGSTATGTWTAEWQDDTDGGQTNPPEYRFKTRRVNSNEEIVSTTDLEVTSCGDSIIDTEEACDDGANNGNDGYCKSDCSGVKTYCGDGTIQDDPPNDNGGVEVCDDGANNGVDGSCKSDCSGVKTYCGDGETQPLNDNGENEACDGETGCVNCAWAPEVRWVNSVGVEITEKAVVLGSTEIHMNLRYTGFADGTTVNFEVWDNDLVNNGVRTVSEGNAISLSTIDGETTATWILTQADKDDIDGVLENYEGFYSKVLDSSSSQVGENSGPLKIVISEADCSLINLCSDYETSGECNADETLCQVGPASAPGEINCGVNGVECLCAWDDSAAGTAEDPKCKPAYTEPTECGNSFLDPGEQCGEGNPVTLGCEDFDNFESSTINPLSVLSCSDCMFDTNGCTGGNGVGVCGDGIVNVGEQCESATDVADLGCSDFGFSGDEALGCYPAGNVNECYVDTSNCGGDSREPCIVTRTINADGACDEGTPNMLEYSWVSKKPDGTICDSGSSATPCPAQAQLPFFGWFGVVVSVLLITTIYLVVAVKRKKKD